MTNPMRTEVIKRFLISKTHNDLANLYNSNMEVQVNVAQDGGDRIESEYQGRQWHGWTDGIQTWKSFRIPYKANTEPEYQDKPMSFDLEAHVEGIGLTGWDWVNKISRWVAFDFDAIVGHSEHHDKKLTDSTLKEIQQQVSNVSWVTLRHSTSGNGLHLYVFLNNVPTANHTEHAALARAVLGSLSAITGYDLKSKVDACGGNIWVWHRKMQGRGLLLIKRGEILKDIPINWKDHVRVISGKRNKILPNFVETSDTEQLFEELAGQRNRIPLDDEHKKLIDFLQDSGFIWYWDNDHHMLVTHAYALKLAHQALGMRGVYNTISPGSDPNEQNCFNGETEVITKDGVFTLAELVNQDVELYVKTDKGFEWVKSRIACFGEQTTFPITFGDGHTVRTTYNHEWLVYRNKQITRVLTYDLKENRDYAILCNRKLPKIDYEGYAHGFVFGDGWHYVDKKGRESCQVAFFDHKKDLIPIINKFGLYTNWKLNKKYTDFVVKLPANWKILPKNPTQEYALGFILGLISADGNVPGSNHTAIGIFQSDYLILEKIRKLAIHAGLKCFKIHVYNENQSFKKDTIGFCMRVSSYNLTTDHLIRKDQKKKFIKRENHFTTTITKIDYTDLKNELVYCAIVPRWHNFTLANGVVTGNCFCSPKRRGAWSVRRFTPGVQEADTWNQDRNGYTHCYLNQQADLRTAAKSAGGVEDTDGGFIFREAEVANQAANLLGVDFNLPSWISSGRQTKLKEHKDGRLIVEIKHEDHDVVTPEMSTWLIKKGMWQKIYNVRMSTPLEPETDNYDDVVRHLVTETGADHGWVIKNEESWVEEPYVHVKAFLQSLGMMQKEVIQVMGSCISKHWRLVNRPFQDEYVGDRQWNRNAAQLRFAPSDPSDTLHHPSWDMILNHIGQGLNGIITEHPWAKLNHIMSGADYLKCWLSSLFKEPLEPLPYLFLWGPQNSGKSIFHEAIELLVTAGCVRADTALISQSGFNAELANAVLCIIEETDLQKSKVAYNRLKDWVVSRNISIHRKGSTPYMLRNSTHWVQASNDLSACPVFPGDSRITMLYVPDLEKQIPKKILLPSLEKEAPDFLASLISLELPYSDDRLNIPVIETQDKIDAQAANRTLLEEWLEDHVFHTPGYWTKYSDLYEAFREWLPPDEAYQWSMIRFGKELPKHKFPKGRSPANAQWYIGNISLELQEPNGTIYKLTGDKLILVEGEVKNV